jgi:hypothetical protein
MEATISLDLSGKLPRIPLRATQRSPYALARLIACRAARPRLRTGQRQLGQDHCGVHDLLTAHAQRE